MQSSRTLAEVQEISNCGYAEKRFFNYFLFISNKKANFSSDQNSLTKTEILF